MLQHADPRDRRPTFRELEALHALIESRKTTSAASKLGVSQPAVSRAIQQLESRLGKALFSREGGRLSPTRDGILLYQQSLPIFEALSGLGRIAGEDEGAMVRIIAPPTIAHRFLPEVAAAFLVDEPGIGLQIEVGTTSDVVAKMADRAFDIGIIDSRVNHPAIGYEPFRRSEAHVVIPGDHPLASRAELMPADLDGQPFIALTRRFAMRATLDQMFVDAGIAPRIVAEAATSAIAFELVKCGVGLTVLNPFPLAFRPEGGVVLRPLRPAAPFETSFVLPTQPPPTRAARKFMDFLRRHQRDDGHSTPLR
jgi:DNA-binding transcriptional LysR family regulator